MPKTQAGVGPACVRLAQGLVAPLLPRCTNLLGSFPRSREVLMEPLRRWTLPLLAARPGYGIQMSVRAAAANHLAAIRGVCVLG